MNGLYEQLSIASRLLDSPVSAMAIATQTTQGDDGRPQLDSLSEVMRSYGFTVSLSKRKLSQIPIGAAPVILLLQDDESLTIDDITLDNMQASKRVFSVRRSNGVAQMMTEDELASRYLGYCWFVQKKTRVDMASELPEYTMEKAWFWKIILRYKAYYGQVLVASFIINVLALVTSLYVMNVYDRVIPNKAMTTLWVLSLGVLAAMLFEFVAKMIRGYLTDIAGKKADLVISAAIFRRVMAIDLAAKPASSGSYANNLRDFESVREFMTSASLLAFMDLPFAFLFIGVIWMVAGPLWVIPVAILVLIVLLGLLAQPRLAQYMNESMREASQRAGLTVEAIEGIETLKANNATNWSQKRWENYNAVISAVSMKLKNLNALVLNGSATLQQAATVFIVLYGTHLIHSDNVEARISMGALIATVILAGRAIAPFSQVAALMTRFQQTKVALDGLNKIIERPTDRDPTRVYISLSSPVGEIKFNGASYSYPGTETPALSGLNIAIKPGEKVGILGRIGSGKSTALRLGAGLFKPAQGNITLDGIDLRQIDPADLRSAVHLFSQHPRLFLGTLRTNLELGRTDVFCTDQELIAALDRFGLAKMVQGHPKGLDMELGEDGQGLSGGQQQVVALARMTLRNPRVVLLDEPTSGVDQGTEMACLKAIKEWADDRTLLIVTHRPLVLEIVDRIVVIDGGRVVMDGPKAQVLDALAKGVNPAANAQPAATSGAKPSTATP